MSVRSKRHPVYKSSTERGGRGKKVYLRRDKGTPYLCLLYHHQRIIIKLEISGCQIEIWEHVVFLDSTSIIKIAVACFEYFMI